MEICRQGKGHFINGINNQDFYFCEENVKIITDGCSEAKYSEVGTRLFAQYFTMLENHLDYTKFEENVETVFSMLLSNHKSMVKKVEREDFIANNLLFTILACFELEDKFIVKTLGDGYIITVNQKDIISYTRLSYGKMPPYYAYNELDVELYKNKLTFKTFEYDKLYFKKVGIATDGIAPIVEGKIKTDFSDFILTGGKNSVYVPEGVIEANISEFFDDVTILI